MERGLTIGGFSELTHLSVKTLRHYHEAGLLEPAEVDPQTGYRYYRTTQIPTAQVIRRFRDLGMPVAEVREVLATADPQARNALITRHLERLEDQLDQTRAAVASMRRLLEPGAAPIEVDHRSVPAATVAAVSGTVDRADVLGWYGDAVAELDAALASSGSRPTGPVGGLYDNELFTEERGDAVVYLPVDDPPTNGRVHPFVVPAAELTVTIHRGSHDDIDVSYGALGTFVAGHSLTVAGPVRELYLVGPRDTDDPAAWRTEIGWPVFRTAGD
jgi:DNA-binding transcriptional MerR regulator